LGADGVGRVQHDHPHVLLVEENSLMAESVRCVLEVYAAPTFSLSTPIHTFGAVVGDNVTFIVTMTAVGAFTDDVDVHVENYPDGAIITYDPADGVIEPGGHVHITVDTDDIAAGLHDLTIVGDVVPV
jgi:phage baseplate assembly protein gpV